MNNRNKKKKAFNGHIEYYLYTQYTCIYRRYP